MWQRWVNSILGVWLALAPVVRLDAFSVKMSNLFIGVLVAVVSSSTPIIATIWEPGLGVVAGAWIAFSSSFQFFAAGPGYLWSNVASGLLILASAQFAARRTTSKSVSDQPRQM